MRTHNICFLWRIDENYHLNFHRIPTLSVQLERARDVARCLKLPLALYIMQTK